MFKFALFALALGLVTRNNTNKSLPGCRIRLFLMETVTLRAYKDLKVKHFLSEK